jgi:hypothetical protein
MESRTVRSGVRARFMRSMESEELINLVNGAASTIRRSAYGVHVYHRNKCQLFACIIRDTTHDELQRTQPLFFALYASSHFSSSIISQPIGHLLPNKPHYIHN